MTVETLTASNRVVDLSQGKGSLESVGEQLNRAERLGGGFSQFEIGLIEQQAGYYSRLREERYWPANPASDRDGAKIAVLFRRLGVNLSGMLIGYRSQAA